MIRWTENGYVRWTVVLAVGAVLFVIGCAPNPSPHRSERLGITVSILPQRYFVEQIGGDRVDVDVMVLPGESPATYEPRPAQLRALSEADAYVAIGVPFENVWLDRIVSANREMRLIDTTEGIERMGAPETPDPHIWLSPELVKIQTETIYEALASLDPAHEEEYAANLGTFVAEIEALDADIRRKLADLDQRKFMVFHPSWAYFARDYRLEMIPIEAGGQEPSAAELAALVVTAREEKIQVVFAQPEFDTKEAETIANEIGGKVLLISPLAEDWLNNMRRVSEAFARELDPSSGE